MFSLYSLVMLTSVSFLLGKEEDMEDRRGTYVVREEVERAPVYSEPCSLVKTAVQVSINVKKIFLYTI